MARRWTTATLRGPVVWVAWIAVVGWLALGVGALVTLEAPLGTWLGLLWLVLAFVTGAVAVSLGVGVGPDGVRLPGREPLAWADIESVSVRTGVLSQPVLNVRQGRGLDGVPLEGLAWFGSRTARRFAETISDAGDLGPVAQVARQAPARRGRAAA